MASKDALSFPCPNYFFKSPGLDQEGSAYGDETVRYFKFQKKGKMKNDDVGFCVVSFGFS